LDLPFALTAFVSIFAIIDPIGVVPLFTILTQGYNQEEKRNVITKCILAALLTLLIFGLAGQYIFLTFGFTIPAFQIAGGILLFSVAFDMLRGERSKSKITNKEEAIERETIGIVPLGIPLLAGPGAITTVIMYLSAPSLDVFDKVFVFVAVLVTLLITFYLLTFADSFSRLLGFGRSLAISRIMGLLLASIAVQFIINGIVGAARMNGLILYP